MNGLKPKPETSENKEVMRWLLGTITGPRRRWAQQHGFAVPTVLFMLLAASAIVGVGITAAVRAQHGTSRDADVKTTLLAAEAGVSQALLHYNRVPTTPATPCVVSTGGTVTLAATTGGWCPESTGSLDDSTFSYRVMPTNGTLEIVSTGIADGVTRRVNVTAESSSGRRMFTEATVLAQDWINLNSNAQILTGVATNGDITMASNARLCGSASTGIGRNLNATSNAQWYEDYVNANCVGLLDPNNAPEEELFLPPVNQGDAATNNDNNHFFGLDLVSGATSKVCWNGVRANGSAGSCGARELSMSSNTSITLSGDTYSFCRLSMNSNTTLFVAAGATVRIYFDSPENCGYGANAKQLELDSNARITASSGGPSNVALLFVGSSNIPTQIDLDSNTQVAGDCEQNFVIYAPRTAINMDSNSTYCGALAGKTIQIDSNARVYSDAASRNFELPGAPPHYVADRFVECTGNAATAPNAGC